MPAATTHVIFAQDVYQALPTQYQKEITNMQMFQMGSQGPDMLFFSNFSYLPGTLQPIGNRMHDEKVKEVIAYFDKHATTDSDLRSYFDGFLCHYALDRNEHPLVNALSRQTHQRMGRSESEIHFLIEGEYDVYMLEKKNRTWKDYDVYKSLKLSKTETQKLAILYHGMLKHVYDIDVSEAKLMDAIQQVYLVTYLLKPNALKYNFAAYIESLLKAPKMITSMMLCASKKPHYLNNEHKPWHPIYDTSITRTESFDDLYQESLQMAIRLIASHNVDTDFTLNFCGEPTIE